MKKAKGPNKFVEWFLIGLFGLMWGALLIILMILAPPIKAAMSIIGV